MILWIILFLFIVAISLILAYLSMRDYQEIPQQTKEEYGLFLVRQITQLNPAILDSIRQLTADQGLIISMERLLKGKQAALAIFGPKKVLARFTDRLDLLELEDYTLNLNSEDVTIWEVGAKDTKKVNPSGTGSIFKNLPSFNPADQFFWQVVLHAKKADAVFETQIRAMVFAKEPQKRQSLVAALQSLSVELVKIPRPFSQPQMLDFYKQRSFSKDSQGPVLTSEALINLLKVV